MNEETSAGALAMQTETETRTDWLTRRRGEMLADVWAPDGDTIGSKVEDAAREGLTRLADVRPPDEDTIGSKVEDAAREGLTVPEVMALALLALLVLFMLGSLAVFSFLYVLLILAVPGLVMLALWII